MDQLDCSDGKSKKPPASSKSCRCTTTTLSLLLFLLTNTVSVLLSSHAGAGALLLRRYKPSTIRLWDDSAALLADLNATQSALSATHAQLADLHARLATANSLLHTLLAHMARDHHSAVDGDTPPWARQPAGELKLALGIGNNVTGDEVAPVFLALGHACRRFQNELERYMNYTPGGECPSDESLEQHLMSSGCEPLPRRRCRPRSPTGYVQPLPLPKSLWAMPPDTTVVWDAHRPCKNYSCLARNGGAGGGSFDLRGREKDLWMRDDGALAYSIDAVLAARPKGTVRVGTDVGGASGTFAARMRERGVTVVTTALNSVGPSGSFIASRGLVPVHVGPAHRLPFFDGTLDVVHELGGGGRIVDADVALEFALFDVYRVLRPGGLFWLDHFVFLGAQLNVTFAPMVDKVGFKRVRWNTGRKLERRRTAEQEEWYVSALLEKPMT